MQLTCLYLCSVHESEPSVWHLRNRLMFLVDNLQYYLQVDVLESQYTLLQSAVQATKDFEQIQKAHTLFQANILSQTFLFADKVWEYFSLSLICNTSHPPCMCLLCFLEHSPSWEANSCSAHHVIPCLLSNPKVDKSNQVWISSVALYIFYGEEFFSPLPNPQAAVIPFNGYCSLLI